MVDLSPFEIPFSFSLIDALPGVLTQPLLLTQPVGIYFPPLISTAALICSKKQNDCW